MMKCEACGVEKDPNVLELDIQDPDDTRCIYPPITTVDCVEYSAGRRCKIVNVCQKCFVRLDVDLWISRNCWEKLSPVVPFDELQDKLYPSVEG